MGSGMHYHWHGGKMQNLFGKYGFIPNPGMRNCFYRKEADNEWIMMIKIPDDYENSTLYADEYLPGGLYAVASSFVEDLDDTFVLLRDWINKSEHYELDTHTKGKMHRIEMIEEILPWDIANKLNRYQQDVFIPVKIKEEKETRKNGRITRNCEDRPTNEGYPARKDHPGRHSAAGKMH
jgi:hypothetical protein